MPLIGSILQMYEFDFKPSAPPAGAVIFYVKTDNVIYIQDSLGNEYPFASASLITDLHGDVTAHGPGDVVATVNSVGGSSAANIHTAELAANAATAVNTANTIVKRDAFGDVALHDITLNKIISNDTTQSTNKDTGAIVTEGGLGVEKNINAGGNIIAVGTVTGSNVSGTNSGDVTLAPVGAAPNANGASLSGQVLTLQPADGTHPGLVTILAQVIAGSKTFSDLLHANGGIDLAGANITAVGTVNGVVVELHGARHLPAGSDPLATAAPTTNLDSTTTNAVGTANSFSRSDHGHAITSGTPVTQTPDQANAPGAGPGFAKENHVHNIPAATPVQVGTTNTKGSAASFALSDHIHDHGAQTVPTLHAAATPSANGFMSATDKTKLDASTNLNTPNAIVQRDPSGNFSAGTITANLTGNVSGSAASFTGSLAGDVGGTQSATLIGNGVVTDTKAAISSKPSSTVVATTNQALTGTPTIDGQATTAGTSIVLLSAQTTGSENGPWIVQVGAWTRPTWYPNGGTTQAFQFINTLIRLGTVYQGSIWRMTTAGAITIGTTTTTWVVTPVALNPSTIASAKIQATYVQRVFALTDGTNIATDASLGNTFTVTIAGNRNLSAPTNPTDGQKITYRITQDATGGRGLTFDAVYNFGSLVPAFIPSTGANKVDYVGCIYNSATSKWDVVAISKGF